MTEPGERAEGPQQREGPATLRAGAVTGLLPGTWPLPWPPLPNTARSPPTSRYNDFLHDPLSLCKACNPQPNGENAISARSDLNLANGSYPFEALRQRSHGGIDVKVLRAPGPGLRVGLVTIVAAEGWG